MHITNTALVLEGGGFRGLYTSGVLDALLEAELYFPYAIGISAGAAYGSSYISRQFGRNREITQKYIADPRYISWRNLFRKGNMLDWDFVYDEIPNKLIPLDYDCFFNSSTDFVVGITNIHSGEIEFVSKKDVNAQEMLQLVTASSSLPFISNIAHFKGQEYLDGGIANSIPFDRAEQDGYSKRVVVLTRNKSYRKAAIKFPGLVKLWYRKYPKFVKAMLNRSNMYNQSLERIEQLEKEGKLFVIRPKGEMNVSRIENNPEKLDALYLMGLNEMREQITELKNWLQN